jgi:hypothetical protein
MIPAFIESLDAPVGGFKQQLMKYFHRGAESGSGRDLASGVFYR